MKNFFINLKKRCVYRWWVLPVYALFYFIIFRHLEKMITPASAIHIIEAPLDRLIPFNEAFIIPYYFWFAYIMGTTVFLVLFNGSRKDYYRYEINMMIGMTVFLLVSALFHNGLQLRPETMPRDNWCTHLVMNLYRTDTPTNVFPSMHVYNSVAAYLALKNCRTLRNRRGWQILFLIVTVLIILSTMFLKQHSVLDVLSALALNAVSWSLLYLPDQRAKKISAARPDF